MKMESWKNHYHSRLIGVSSTLKIESLRNGTVKKEYKFLEKMFDCGHVSYVPEEQMGTRVVNCKQVSK